MDKSNNVSIKLSNIQKVVAQRMCASLQSSAQVTFHSSCKLDVLIRQYRIMKQENSDISVQDLIIYCLVKSLKIHPRLNSTYTEGDYLLHKNVNLNFAVSLGDDALVAPQIFHADELSIKDIAVARKELTLKAYDNKLPAKFLKSGSFTISNLGKSRVIGFTPIINIPQVAILGIAGLDSKVIVSSEGNIIDATFLNFSLTVDHRVINGSTAVKFINSFIKFIESFGQ